MSIERLQRQIDQAIVPKTNMFEVKGPEICGLTPEFTAKTMVAILSANYGIHNLSSSWEPLSNDIKTGKVLPFISFDQQKNPVACAALIRLNNHDVEIGRGACWPGRNGGHALPLLLAAHRWQSGNAFPESQIFRAEVRTAKPTKEVPGGQATQVICLRKIGLISTAMAPLFHHGVPNRQEIFILASRFKNENSLKHSNNCSNAIPDNLFEDENERQIFGYFWINLFGKHPKIERIGHIKTSLTNFSAHREGPLLVITPATTNEIIEVNKAIESAFSEDIRFAVARIPLTGNIVTVAGQVEFLRQSGINMMGYEPVFVEDHLEIQILLRKLFGIGKARLITPSFVEGIFSHDIEDILLQNSLKWRKL